MCEDFVFCQLIVSMTTALNSQAKASFSVAAFLRQVRRELFVSHLPGSTHPSVKHDLLSTSSTPALFFFVFYEWEHRTGTMCPFSSLDPLGKGKERQLKA